MLRIFSTIIVVFMLSGCCEEDCQDCSQSIDDFIIEQAIDLGNFVTIEKNGAIEVNNVKVSENAEFTRMDILIEETKSALITCNQFGIPNLCKLTGTKGRTLAKASASPEWTDFSLYMESGSEFIPGDITSTTYYNENTYIHQGDTSANAAALHAAVALWDTGAWINARVDFCTIGNPVLCVQ